MSNYAPSVPNKTTNLKIVQNKVSPLQHWIKGLDTLQQTKIKQHKMGDPQQKVGPQEWTEKVNENKITQNGVAPTQKMDLWTGLQWTANFWTFGFLTF